MSEIVIRAAVATERSSLAALQWRASREWPIRVSRPTHARKSNRKRARDHRRPRGAVEERVLRVVG
jgi:hypothetical protein